jgi:hypothetical protein
LLVDLLVDVDPDTAAPIAVAFMFAPLVVVLIGKLPIVSELREKIGAG